MTELDQELFQARERLEQQKQAESKLIGLRERRKALSLKEEELSLVRRREQSDVDKLEGRSLAAFFYSVVGKMDEKLDRELAEARAAAVKHDAAVRELADVDWEIEALTAKLEALGNCREQYAEAYARKAEEIRRRDPVGGPQLLELEERLAALDAREREIQEAVRAGEAALRAAEGVAGELSDAAGWGTWDLLGGGLIADLAKYDHLDAAQSHVEQLQVLLSRFQTELADVTVQADIQVRMEGFLQFADFFFDGLFADWAAMDHISRAQDQVSGTIAQIHGILLRLQELEEETGEERTMLQGRRDGLVLRNTAGQ